MSEKIDLFELADKVKSREDLYVFINCLINEYKQNRENWENNDVESFLSGLGGITYDLDGWYHNNRPGQNTEKPSWSAFAHMLHIASVYE